MLPKRGRKRPTLDSSDGTTKVSTASSEASTELRSAVDEVPGAAPGRLASVDLVREYHRLSSWSICVAPARGPTKLLGTLGLDCCDEKRLVGAMRDGRNWWVGNASHCYPQLDVHHAYGECWQAYQARRVARETIVTTWSCQERNQWHSSTGRTGMESERGH